ncbi:FHA domain-containing protein [Nocardia sp. NPDC052254]|uniref:FHA domain-containing protein n=1 Tax=Nocardia sp. NPDC052254 TaxID=3155681 RepID=UPI0034248CEC
MDRQVEVVAGNHVVVRVAGAVVVVGYRGPGRVRPDAPAMRAAETVAQLVSEASERAPGGPGRTIAREATRWLMQEAEQVDGSPVDLGILSHSETGGVAIFLHGAVTAVLVGARGAEYYRGVDAAFTVDRVAEPPARAVAVFIDDERGRIPDLPERGIGSLIEGVAAAAGAVIWFEGDRTRARDRVERPAPTAARHRADPPTTQLDEQRSAPGPAQPAPPPPRSPETDERQPMSRPGTGPEETLDDPRLARTQLRGTNPAPEPDPALERRMEQTARATSISVRVMGFTCARAHPSDPRSAFCTVCGMPVDQTQPPTEVVRPPLGILVLDDGMTYLLAADVVIGRDPENSEAAARGLVPVKIEDSSGGMSRAHAEVRLVNWDITVVDRGSTNGTRARPAGYRDWIRLQPNQPMVLPPGSEIMLGNRVLRVEPAAPPPFG